MDSSKKVGLVFGIAIGSALAVGILVESGKQRPDFNVLHAPSRPQEEEPRVVLSGWVEFNPENERVLAIRVLVENNLKENSIENLAVRVNATGHLHGACWDGDRLQCTRAGGTAPATLGPGESTILGAEIQVQRSGIFPIFAEAEWVAGGASGRTHAELGAYQLTFPQESILAAAYAALIALALPLLGFAGGWFLKVFSDRHADQQRVREIHSRIEHEIYKQMFPVTRTALMHTGLLFQANELLGLYNKESQDEDQPKKLLWAVLRLHKAMRNYSKELRQITFRYRQGEEHAAACWGTITKLLRGSFNEIALGKASKQIKLQEKWESFHNRFKEGNKFDRLKKEIIHNMANSNLSNLNLALEVLCAIIEFEENLIMDPWYRPGKWQDSPGDIELLRKVTGFLGNLELDQIEGASEWRRKAESYYNKKLERALARKGENRPRKSMLSLPHGE